LNLFLRVNLWLHSYNNPKSFSVWILKKGKLFSIIPCKVKEQGNAQRVNKKVEDGGRDKPEQHCDWEEKQYNA
jgi:hypothetical protein